MPIVEETPSTPPVEQPNPIRIASPKFLGVTVDTRYEPATSLLTHIEGASWTVNYYSQVLDRDNALSGQNQDRDAVYQQYRLIQGLELKVTTALNQSQDTTTMEFKVSGQANVFPCGLTPNPGDMFIADGGDGRELVFEVMHSEQRSIYKDAAFIIDYDALNYSDTRIDDLNSKVVENLYYEADFLLHGQNPLISLPEKQLLNQLHTRFEEISAFYFERFMSREFRTLLLPGQDFAIYDPFLTKAVLSLFRDSNIPQLKYIRDLNVGQDDRYDSITVWDLLSSKRRNLFKGMVTKVGLANAGSFSIDPMMNSLRYSGVGFAVYPVDGFLSEDTLRLNRCIPLSSTPIKRTASQLRDLFELIYEVSLHGLVHPEMNAVNIVSETSYVFSNAFYANADVGQSALELLVQNYVDEKSYDLNNLMVKLANTYTSWAPLEQFYQLPFLLAIMRSAIRRM